MYCPFCNKWVDPELTECPHCGETNPLSPTAPPDEYVKVLVRLQREKRVHELLHHTPSRIRLWSQPLWQIPLGWVLGGVIFGYFGARGILGAAPSGKLSGFDMLLLTLGVVGTAAGAPRLIRIVKSPLVRLPAIVLRKRRGFTLRTNIRFLTIKTEDAQEKEYVVDVGVFRESNEGDRGIAYFKGGILLDFKRAIYGKG